MTDAAAAETAADDPRDTDGHRRFLADAASRQLDVEVVRHAPATSLEEAAAALGILPSDVVKSLVIKLKGVGYAFVLIPGGRSASWPKVRATFQVNKAQMPSPDEALEATGFARGTISPIGSTTAWPVVIDEGARGRRIALGAGAHGLNAFVDADALAAAYGATFADISDPEKPRPSDA